MRTAALLTALAFLALASTAQAEDARTTVNEGLAAFQSGNADQGIKLLTDAIDSRDLSGVTLANVYYDRGGMYLAKADYDHAIADADSALKVTPGYGAALKMRGTAKFAKNDADGAIADFQAAEKALPGDAGVHLDFGNALRVKGRFDEALAEFNATIAMKPTALALTGRAVVYISMNKNEPAVADLSEAIRLQPDYVTAYIDRAGAYSALGKFDLAGADFDTVLKYRPGAANPIAGRANAQAKLGHADQATAAYDQMLAANPNDGAAHRKRGDTLFAAHQYAKAIDDY